MHDCYKQYERLRNEMDRWLVQSCWMDIPGRNGGGEDEANYSLAFFPHYLVTGNPQVVLRFRDLLADLSNWVDSECKHGYEPVAEAHHGTEPFLLFLPRFLGLFPEDLLARKILEDAAEHIGNWVDEIHDWYDYDRDCFYSFQIGTEVLGEEPEFAFELAEHFRFIHIALAAYRLFGDERYLDWSLRYGRKRARRILDCPEGPLPALWNLNGQPIQTEQIQSYPRLLSFLHSHHVPGDPLGGAENLLASGALYALGDLFLLSGNEVFHQAAFRMVEPLVDELLDPFADPAAAALAYYRVTFQDRSLDERTMLQVSAMPPAFDGELAMVFPEEQKRREPGVGKRMDMVYWGEWSDDGSVKPLKQPSTAALALAYQLTGDTSYAARAFKLAGTKLAMARQVLRGGREHADMGGAICSVAAGHGRNWGHGAVTGCYGPLLLGTREVQSQVSPLIQVKDAHGQLHLPAGILALISPPVSGPGAARFFNASQAPISFSWQPVRSPAEEDWHEVTLRPGQTHQFPLPEISPVLVT